MILAKRPRSDAESRMDKKSLSSLPCQGLWRTWQLYQHCKSSDQLSSMKKGRGKNRKKNGHTANTLDGRVLMHIPVLFLLKLKPSNQERHLVLTSLTEAGPYRRFSVISLISMHEWEYTWIRLGQQQQVAPRSTPILHCTKNALQWGLCGILSKFGHARLLWRLGSSQISKSPRQMCPRSGQ